MKFLPYRILPTGNGHWQVVDMPSGVVIALLPTRREARACKWMLEQKLNSMAAAEEADAVAAPR